MTTIEKRQEEHDLQVRLQNSSAQLINATANNISKNAKNKIEKEHKRLSDLLETLYNTPAIDTPVTATPAIDTPVTATPVIDTPVTATPVIDTPVTAIKFAVSTRKAIASNSGLIPLYLAISCHPNKDGNLKTEYTVNCIDGCYELSEFNLLGTSNRSKSVASFEFSRSQGLIVTSSKITLERVDTILRDIYNAYRQSQIAVNSDYFFLFLLSVMSIADSETNSGITSYKPIAASVYRDTLTRFGATFKTLADREKLIADRLSAFNL